MLYVMPGRREYRFFLLFHYLSGDPGNVITAKRISKIFINKEFIQVINRIVANSSLEDAERILANVKRVLIQVPRMPDPIEMKYEKAEFAQFFKDIRHEQIAYDPIKWINAESEYIRYLRTAERCRKRKLTELNERYWLSSEDMLIIFNCSISTLNRIIADGMPCKKIGGRKVFVRSTVND